MKQFLRIAYAQLLTCLCLNSFSQTTYNQAGTYQWVCPAGVTRVTLQMWGGGGQGTYYTAGGGGAFVQTSTIPVTPGQTYLVKVGHGQTDNIYFSADSCASKFGQSGSWFVTANAGHSDNANTNGNSYGGAASSGGYVNQSYSGGNGANGWTSDGPFALGGASSASPCGAGINTLFCQCNDEMQGRVGTCGGGSGGNSIDFVAAYNGGFPGGGGGGGGELAAGNYTSGGGGEVILTTCPDAGQIGIAHTVTFPPEMVPDSIKSISYNGPGGLTFLWQQSADNLNFVTAKNNINALSYRFDLDSIQTTTYYRRGNNGCTTGFDNWSNVVQIKEMNSTNGRNGQVTGYVQTRLASPIKDRKVFVQNLTPLKGRAAGFLDSAYTDEQGKFIVDSVFYGDKNNGDSATVRFKVYPDTANGHRYSPASRQISLTYNNHTYDFTTAFPFQDTTVFGVTGQVTQTCKQCLDKNGVVKNITGPLDSVSIVGIGKNNDVQNHEKDSVTTRYLNPPRQYGRYGLSFQFSDQYTITPSFHNHKFIPKDTLITVNSNVANVNFNDTTTHVISGFYGAGCGDVIGTAVLEFDDVLLDSIGNPRGSVFRKQVTTSNNGHYSIKLPARKYKVKIVSASVKDSLDASTTQNLIKSYFNALPPVNLTRDITNADSTLDLIYHRSPQIAVAGLYDDSSRVQTCAAFKNYEFWPQSVRRGITFKVYQGPVSRGCLLDTGRVFVKTDISNTLGNYQYDTITLAGGIGVDSIMAAQPNTVINANTGTYSKTFSAKFSGDILHRTVVTDTIHPALPIIVVTGAAIDPNSTDFVTVSPQLPFVVLHDPAGNRSLSSWTQSVTTEQAISFKAEQQNTEGGFINVKVGLSQILGLFVEIPIDVWVKIDQNFSTTNTTTNTSESIITNTTEKTIVTADDPPSTGEGADVVYGAALNINYKLGTEIDWDSSTCAVIGPKPVMVTDIKNDTTSFLYTIGHITDELIPTLRQAADAQTNADSVAYFENQIHVWEQLVANNSENIKNAPILQNISFSNGTTSTYTNTLENSTSNTYDFNLEIDKDLAISAGFDIGGIGLDGGYNVGFKMTTGSSITNTTKASTTTSYTLKDDNGPGPHFEGDYFSVNVKKDPVYGTPMFETVGGGSMCPYVPGTIPLDNPVLTANVQSLTGVTKDTASFTVYMNNLSLDPTPQGARPYVLFLRASSNPSGATVLIGGTSDPNGVTYDIPNNGGVQTVTISVIRNSASGVYNYDDLEFIMSDNCFGHPVAEQFFNGPHQFSSIKLSADFVSPVSGITMVTPVSNWVANMASNNKITVKFTGYDTSRLSSVAFQYNLPGTGTWTTVTNFTKSKLGSTTTTYTWNISKLADGPYNLRLMVKDKFGNTIYSPVTPGIIDRKPPAIFGVPRPVSGVYTAGTQIAFLYAETIITYNLRNSMVELRDMTAGATVPFRLSAFNNKMIITPLVSILANKGHLFRVAVDSVSDLYGNIKTRPDTSYFTVGTTNFSTGSDALNVTTNPASIFEDSKSSIKVRFTRNSKVTGPTLIYYNLAGNAVYNKDYTVTYNNGQTTATGIDGSEGTIVLPKDSSGASLYIHPINDSILSPDKILTITLSEGGGYGIGSNYSITDTILNHSTIKPVITANKETTQCFGDSVTLSTANKINGVNVKSYLWSTGAKTQSITVKTSGSYTVKVTDNNGLIGYSDPAVVTFTCGSPVNLVANVLSITRAALNWNVQPCAKKYVVRYRKVGNASWLTDTVNTNLDTLKTLKANTSYEWQVASICQYPLIIVSAYTAGTNFTTPVSLADISVTHNDDYKAATAGDGFSAVIYPNPASTSTNLEVKGITGHYSVMVENLQGVILWKAEELTDSSVKLPLSNFSSGTYIVIIYDGKHTGRLKLVKQ